MLDAHDAQVIPSTGKVSFFRSDFIVAAISISINSYKGIACPTLSCYTIAFKVCRFPLIATGIKIFTIFLL
jgi:hypothetical protein